MTADSIAVTLKVASDIELHSVHHRYDKNVVRKAVIILSSLWMFYVAYVI